MTTRRTTARTATTIEERIAEVTITATATATPTTFGIELEMTGISRKTVGKLVYEYLQSQEEMEVYCMDTCKIIDQQGRKWSVDCDGSIHGDFLEQVELITPILTMKDLPLLKGLVETFLFHTRFQPRSRDKFLIVATVN
ncbi:MAG: amidoligase family protein, partial [Synergistaceae bacterium]|nr:amidoligase family protein [Synergistaceae bacterium]